MLQIHDGLSWAIAYENKHVLRLGNLEELESWDQEKATRRTWHLRSEEVREGGRKCHKGNSWGAGIDTWQRIRGERQALPFHQDLIKMRKVESLTGAERTGGEGLRVLSILRPTGGHFYQ